MKIDRRYKRVRVVLDLEGANMWAGDYVAVSRGEVRLRPRGRCLGRLSLWDRWRVHGWGDDLIGQVEDAPAGPRESGPVWLKVYLPGEASPGWRLRVWLFDAASTAFLLAPAAAAAALAWAAYAYWGR